ncbi:hypothetical protein Trydic_g12430 [Trypoxylus dichotomus]
MGDGSTQPHSLPRDSTKLLSAVSTPRLSQIGASRAESPIRQRKSGRVFKQAEWRKPSLARTQYQRSRSHKRHKNKRGSLWKTLKTQEGTQVPSASSGKKDTGGQWTEEGSPANQPQDQLHLTSHLHKRMKMFSSKRQETPPQEYNRGNTTTNIIRMYNPFSP